MDIHSTTRTVLALVLLGLAHAASAQTLVGAASIPAPDSDADLRNVLVWNSPWEGRGTAPGRGYSYRTVFHQRRDAVVAEVIAYATNQRTDSVVDIRDGRASWRDANGADVSVALAAGGNLVGTAVQQSNNLPIVLRPRP